MTLLSTSPTGQSGPGSDGNERVLRISRSSIITGTLPSDRLLSYPGHLLARGSYRSAEKQSVYSTAPVWEQKQHNRKYEWIKSMKKKKRRNRRLSGEYTP